MNETIPGVFIQVCQLGILIRGKSGVGKSELALELINRGHQLIADDAVCITQGEQNEIIAYCPPSLQDFLAVYSLGLLNIRKLFGDKAIITKAPIELIITLSTNKHKSNEYNEFDPLQGAYSEELILSKTLPALELHINSSRALATLIETAAKKEKLKNIGCDFKQDFLEMRGKVMENKR